MPTTGLPDSSHIRQDEANLNWYTRYWNTVERARSTWEVMTFEQRKKITEHLYDVAKKVHLGSVSVEIAHEELSRDKFSSALALEELSNETALMSLAAPYVALYYTNVGGTFAIDHFEKQYPCAINF